MARRLVYITERLFNVLSAAASQEGLSTASLAERELRRYVALPPAEVRVALPRDADPLPLLGADAMLESVFAEPEREWPLIDLWRLRGGSAGALKVDVARLSAAGALAPGSARGLWKAGAREAWPRRSLLACLRCGHGWRARVSRPKVCPQCKSPQWDIARDRAATSPPPTALPRESSIRVGPPPEQTVMLGRTETPAPPRITAAPPARNQVPAAEQRPFVKPAAPCCPCCGRPSMKRGVRCGNCAIACRPDGAGGFTPGPMCPRAPRPAPLPPMGPEVDARGEEPDELDRAERRARRLTPPPAPPNAARPPGERVPVAKKSTPSGGGVVML